MLFALHAPDSKLCKYSWRIQDHLNVTCYFISLLFAQHVCASACNTDTTPTQPHRNSNTHRTKITTNVVIQQNSRKLLVMDILMSETCWAHNKWNKIASDIKLVFYSSTITMMHGPINISLCKDCYQVRHPRCVNRITSRVKCSQTQLLAFMLLRGVSTYLSFVMSLYLLY